MAKALLEMLDRVHRFSDTQLVLELGRSLYPSDFNRQVEREALRRILARLVKLQEGE